MTASRLLLVLLALLGLAAGLVVFLMGGSETSVASPATSVAPTASAVTPTDLEPARDLEPTVTPRVGGRAQVAAEPTETTWVAGRDALITLVLPEDAPADPELALVAVTAETMDDLSGRELLHGLRTGEVANDAVVRVPLNGATAVKLPLPSGFAEPRLLVDGRFLFMAEPYELGTDETSATLTPEVGAALVVRLTAPIDSTPTGELSVFGGDFSGRSRRGFEQLETETRGDAPVEFRALDTSLTWTVSPDMEALHGYTEMGVELEAGRERVLDVALTRGATVSGEVLDDSGAPRVGVEVRTSGGGMNWFGGNNRRETETDRNGRFELTALPPGEVTVEAIEEGWVTAESDTLEIADGERAEGLRLIMTRGLAIAGQVLNEDGAPSPDTEIAIEAIRARQGWGGWGGSRLRRVGSATTDEVGRFRVSGLEEGKFTVRATLELDEEEGGAAWRAVEEAVPGGTENLLLTLAGPLRFRGRVVDDRGEPIPEFEIVVRAVRDGGPREAEGFESEDGSFSFARVGPGEWEVSARAEGHVESPTETITLPMGASELVLTLEREAVIAGRVFDANGAPAPGATVRGDDGSNAGGNPWRGPRGPRTETNADGEFEMTVDPGGVALVASQEGWADSESVAVELSPGDRIEGAQLSLRIGGGIIGTVVTPEGDPRPGRRVVWGSNAMGFGSRGETTTDSSGRFEFTNVTPGEWAVSAAPSMSEMGRNMRGKSGQTAFVEAMGDLVTETVTVLDGEIVEVFLGGEPKKPVRVYGIVSRDGEPLAGAQVYAVAEGNAVFEGMKTTLADEDGSYELVVDRPGPYAISANSGRVGVEEMVDIPRADEARIDLTLPLGRIEGVVRGPDGVRTSGVSLTIQREDGLGRMRWSGSQATTDADGKYAFEDLEAGFYTVRANASGFGGPGSGSVERSWGSDVISQVEVVKDRVTSGIDFRMSMAGKIEGIVRDPSGAPAAGVTVFFRDEAGRMISTVSGTRTNAAGRFEKSGLSPGTYTLSARADDMTANDAATVSVRSSETASVEFDVETGAYLIVTLEDSEGEAQRARVEVLDGDEVQVSGMMTVQRMQSMFNEGASTREQRIGPLPPGRYRVRATTADGKTKDKRVTVRSRDTEKKVKLKLPD